MNIARGTAGNDSYLAAIVRLRLDCIFDVNLFLSVLIFLSLLLCPI